MDISQSARLIEVLKEEEYPKSFEETKETKLTSSLELEWTLLTSRIRPVTKNYSFHSSETQIPNF